MDQAQLSRQIEISVSLRSQVPVERFISTAKLKLGADKIEHRWKEDVPRVVAVSVEATKPARRAAVDSQIGPS